MGFAGRWVRKGALVILAVIWATAATAQEPDGTRVALVIGNGAYQSVPALANPPNDAQAVADAFGRVGFDVTLVLDGDQETMRHALQDFELKAAVADVAVVYYAGHGIEVDGVDYLIPIDAELSRDTHVFDEAIPLDRVMVSVEQAHALRLIILDACRDNPFAARMQRTSAARSVGRGLARVEAGSTLVVFAADAGQVAADGDGDHSPFTTAFLAHVETPGLEIDSVLRLVRDDVVTATNGAQQPVWNASLGREAIYFVPAAPTPQPTATEATDQNDIRADYQAAQAIDTIEAWAAFLRYHTTGLYADLARAALNKLQGLAEEAAASAAPAEAAPVVADLPVFVSSDAGGAPPEAAMPAPAPAAAEVAAPDDAVAAAEPAPAPGALDEASAACDRYAAYRYDLDRPQSVEPVRDATLQHNTRPALDACRTAVEAHPDDRRMLFQLARVAFLANRTDEAYQSATDAAAMGSAAAMVLVGIHYEYGVAVTQSYADAEAWYRRAADAGSSDGMLYLGYLYDQGNGVPLDLDEAGRWFAMAADAGNAGAISALANRLENGRGVAMDLVAARAMYQRAAEAGDGFAMDSLAAMYEFGDGGPVDYAQARYWYEAAANNGVGVAMASLGYFYELGLGVDADLDLARQWYQRGAGEGDYVSMYALGRIYENGVGVARDYEEAARWYSQSALSNQMPYALVRLGVLFDQGLGVTQNSSTARNLWEQAAAAGEPDALTELGYLYEFGRGVPRSLDTAAQYYVEALAQGSPLALDEFLNHADEYPIEILTAVEAYLVSSGLMTGKADGIFDGATRQALAQLGPA